MPRLPFDPDKAAQALRLQRQCPAWLVMYGPWRRAFTAFYAGPTAEGRIIDAPSTEELRALMVQAEQEAEQELWRPTRAPIDPALGRGPKAQSAPGPFHPSTAQKGANSRT